MDRMTWNQYVPSDVSPPGDTLRELLAERGISQAALATRMGRPQKTISEIANAKAAITPETALELELVLGVPAEFWVARERNYRTYLARDEQAAKLRSDLAWAKCFPVRKMVDLGWLPQASDDASRVRTLLEFFGVASTKQWKIVNESYRVAFRKPSSFAPDEYALSAWLRAGIAAAERRPAKPYGRDLFLDALMEARELTTAPPEKFQPMLADLCAKSGVTVAFVPELPRSRASGVTMWLGPGRALVQLSLRYKMDDHFWFTFFHEAAHVLFHKKDAIFLETDDHASKEEAEADRWAADFLLPPAAYRELVKHHPYYGRDLIRGLARKIGVAPGIVVGRLQHDGLLPHTHCNGLKQRFEWSRREMES